MNYDKQEEWEFTSGARQSPLDIKTNSLEKMNTDEGAITLDYSPTITSEENNGHSIQVAAAGTASINGRTFELTQFHFHAQSEHTVDGKEYPMEAHFVNKAQDGSLAVLAVFLKKEPKIKGFRKF